MDAERETVDRYVAAFLADRVGQIVNCRITGVQSFGFFATVEGLGGDGLLFVRDLGTEYFRFDEAARHLGRRRKRRDLPHRPAARASPRRGQSGQRFAALRIARGQLWRRVQRPAATAFAARRPRENAAARPTSATALGTDPER